MGVLHDIACRLEDVCDSCGKTFIRDINIPEYAARFVEEGSLSKEEEESADEAILIINPKDETIDVTDMIVQAIVLNDPFVKRCDTCEKKLANMDDEEDDL